MVKLKVASFGISLDRFITDGIDAAMKQAMAGERATHMFIVKR